MAMPCAAKRRSRRSGRSPVHRTGPPGAAGAKTSVTVKCGESGPLTKSSTATTLVTRTPARVRAVCTTTSMASLTSELSGERQMPPGFGELAQESQPAECLRSGARVDRRVSRHPRREGEQHRKRLAISDLTDDGDVGGHAQEARDEAAQIDLGPVRPGGPRLHLRDVGQRDVGLEHLFRHHDPQRRDRAPRDSRRATSSFRLRARRRRPPTGARMHARRNAATPGSIAPVSASSSRERMGTPVNFRMLTSTCPPRPTSAWTMCTAIRPRAWRLAGPRRDRACDGLRARRRAGRERCATRGRRRGTPRRGTRSGRRGASRRWRRAR